MAELNTESIDRMRAASAVAIHAHWKSFLFQAAIMIALGLFALAAMLAVVATLAVLRYRRTLD